MYLKHEGRGLHRYPTLCRETHCIENNLTMEVHKTTNITELDFVGGLCIKYDAMLSSLGGTRGG